MCGNGETQVVSSYGSVKEEWEVYGTTYMFPHSVRAYGVSVKGEMHRVKWKSNLTLH